MALIKCEESGAQVSSAAQALPDIGKAVPPNPMSTLSAPDRVVWEYFDSLRRLVRDTKNAESDAQRRQTAALAVVMAVNVVEVFLNLWFRVRVEERHSQEERNALLKDLAHRASLKRKLEFWPKRYLAVCRT